MMNPLDTRQYLEQIVQNYSLFQDYSLISWKPTVPTVHDSPLRLYQISKKYKLSVELPLPTDPLLINWREQSSASIPSIHLVSFRWFWEDFCSNPFLFFILSSFSTWSFSVSSIPLNSCESIHSAIDLDPPNAYLLNRSSILYHCKTNFGFFGQKREKWKHPEILPLLAM